MDDQLCKTVRAMLQCRTRLSLGGLGIRAGGTITVRSSDVGRRLVT